MKGHAQGVEQVMPNSLIAVERLSHIIAQYDAVISDVWGVLHNGITATPGAREALQAVRKSGRPVILLTNAPRPPAAIAAQLADMAIGPESYSEIISSGGVTRSLLGDEGDAGFFHLGPSRDIALFEGLAAQPVSLAEARFVLCTGLMDDETETAETYRGLLEEALSRKLRLFCANPDLVVERGPRLLPCAGAIADLYEKLGGEVIWVGKPRPLVYLIARQRIEAMLQRPVDSARILCIGDALRTDIAGANAADHPSLLILAGIHAHQIGLVGDWFELEALEALFAAANARPNMRMLSLTW